MGLGPVMKDCNTEAVHTVHNIYGMLEKDVWMTMVLGRGGEVIPAAGFCP